MTKKVSLFYHGVDLDGYCSAALVKYFLHYSTLFETNEEVNIRLNPWNYGFKVFKSQYIDSDFIFCTDICFNAEIFEQIIVDDNYNGKHIFVLDHHETQQKLVGWLKENEFVNSKSVCDIAHSGAWHTYNFIKKNLRKDTPKNIVNGLDVFGIVVDMVDNWDTHNYVYIDDKEYVETIKKFKAYMAGIEADCSVAEGWENWKSLIDLAVTNTDSFMAELQNIIAYGTIIKQSQFNLCNNVVPSFVFDCDFEGYKMVCLNCVPGLASDYLNDCKDFEKYDLICTFYFCPRTSQWNFSIRKTDTADEKITLVPIWEKYNKIRSGGHKGAGSIRCNSFKYDSVSKVLELIF